MRIFFFVILFISLNCNAYNQIIKGTVFDSQSKTIISYASIYFNGTFVGTTTNNNGNFELDISKNLSMPLTISAIGYYSLTLTDLSSTKPYLIYLTPKVFELNEVVVNSKSHERERRANMRLFKDEFLGTTINAQYCEIVNESDIKFLYDDDNNILRAFALKPVTINNNALGYEITYYLDSFEYYKNTKSFSFRGNIIFKENSTPEDRQNKSAARQLAYMGSRMHFFRALWANDLESAGFTIQNPEEEKLRYKNLVFQKDSLRKALSFNSDLSICYNMLYISKIEFIKKPLYFEKNGYYDPVAVIWEGEMSLRRIADWLPLEYIPDKNY